MTNRYLLYLVCTALVVVGGAFYALRPAPTLLTTTPAPSVQDTFTFTSTTDTTVLAAMQTLAAENIVAFTSREYPSLGTLIESINGKANANGYYWFLYVNGESSQTGASQTALRTGDVVEWRYKKGE
jgi:hypothetical protein